MIWEWVIWEWVIREWVIREWVIRKRVTQEWMIREWVIQNWVIQKRVIRKGVIQDWVIQNRVIRERGRFKKGDSEVGDSAPAPKLSNTTKSKSHYFSSTRSTKRKDHFFDTGNAPTTAAQPEYKIPRNGKSPATPQVATGSNTPPVAPTFAEVEEVELALLPTEEELSKSLGSSLSFADAASSTTTEAKTKVNYEFLFVNTGCEERLGVSRQTSNLFTKKLTDLVMTRVFDDLPVPKIDWSNLVRGIGVFG